MKTFTRKVLLSVAFCFALMNARAQYVTIPDTNFVNWLNANGFAGCLVGNQMDTTCSAVVNATTLNCANQNIGNITGISYFDNLTSLYCNDNQLTFLPSLPSTINTLYSNNNQLTTLPNLPSSLNIFYCYNNQLTFLPTLPQGVYVIRCEYNQLTSLPTLPTALATLRCEANQLSSLPTLPNSLTFITCGGNQLTAIPLLPALLIYLDCSNNTLNTLPPLPASLITLGCANDQLTSLPLLPLTLRSLICANNQLTSLPILPDTMFFLYINDNPALICLPSIHRITNTFLWGNTGIICFPNALSVGVTANPTIAGIPICTSSSPCFVITNTLHDIDLAQSFTIYPNPITSGTELKVRFNAVTDTQATFSIYDLSGRTVFVENFFSSRQTQSITLPLLVAGIYNCVISSDRGSNHQKLVVIEKTQ